MELGDFNWIEIGLIVLGVIVLWGVASVVLRLTAKVIGCGCSLMVALGVLYFLLRWAGMI